MLHMGMEIYGGDGAWVITIKQEHTHEISQETEDLQVTTDNPWFAGGGGLRMMKMMPKCYLEYVIY